MRMKLDTAKAALPLTHALPSHCLLVPSNGEGAPAERELARVCCCCLFSLSLSRRVRTCTISRENKRAEKQSAAQQRPRINTISVYRSGRLGKEEQVSFIGVNPLVCFFLLRVCLISSLLLFPIVFSLENV